MYTVRYKKKIIIGLIPALVVSLTLSSCGKKNNQPAPQQQATETDQQAEKVPEQLTKMEESIEKIFKELNGPAITAKEEEAAKGGQKDKSQGNQKQDTKQQEKQPEKAGENKEGGTPKPDSQQQATPPPAQPAQPDPWQKINTIVNDLHYQWNAYTPMALKKGANRTTLDNFGNALNGLTNTINAKNRNSTLQATSVLYGYMPDFFYLYKTKASPEIKRIRHFTRNSILNAANGNWAQADADINNLKSSWNIYKNIVPTDQQEAANKVDYAIYEYEKVVKDKNQQLVDIKGRVAMSNIETLEKGVEEASNKK